MATLSPSRSSTWKNNWSLFCARVGSSSPSSIRAHRNLGLFWSTPFTALWDRPEQFDKFVRIFDCVERGCQVVFVGIPSITEETW